MRNFHLMAASCLALAACTTVHTTDLAKDHPPVPPTLAEELRHSVTVLAADIGERNCYHPEKLAKAADWIEAQFKAMGYAVVRQPVEVPSGEPFACGKRTVWNIMVEKKGTTKPDEILVIGAHYDSKVAMPDWHGHTHPTPEKPGTPGADDNASGIAGVLAVARMLKDQPLERTVMFVAFVNEEPPFFQTDSMGSVVCAKNLALRCTVSGLAMNPRPKKAVGMISFEMLGMYALCQGEKRPFGAGLVGMVDAPDYIDFLSNRSSRHFAAQCAESFRHHSPIALRATALPEVSRHVAWSDDWSFWQQGIPAFSATDTSYCRNDHYHGVGDTADTLDYGKMAQTVWGLRFVVEGVGRGLDKN